MDGPAWIEGFCQGRISGKLKTAFTMLSVTILLLVPEGSDSIFDALYEPSIFMLFLSALVTVTSGSVYFKAAAPVLMGKE